MNTDRQQLQNLHRELAESGELEAAADVAANIRAMWLHSDPFAKALVTKWPDLSAYALDYDHDRHLRRIGAQLTVTTRSANRDWSAVVGWGRTGEDALAVAMSDECEPQVLIDVFHSRPAPKGRPPLPEDQRAGRNRSVRLESGEWDEWVDAQPETFTELVRRGLALVRGDSQ